MKEMKTIQFSENGEQYEIVDEKARLNIENILNSKKDFKVTNLDKNLSNNIIEDYIYSNGKLFKSSEKGLSIVETKLNNNFFRYKNDLYTFEIRENNYEYNVSIPFICDMYKINKDYIIEKTNISGFIYGDKEKLSEEEKITNIYSPLNWNIAGIYNDELLIASYSCSEYNTTLSESTLKIFTSSMTEDSYYSFSDIIEIENFAPKRFIVKDDIFNDDYKYIIGTDISPFYDNNNSIYSGNICYFLDLKNKTYKKFLLDSTKYNFHKYGINPSKIMFYDKILYYPGGSGYDGIDSIGIYNIDNETYDKISLEDLVTIDDSLNYYEIIMNLDLINSNEIKVLKYCSTMDPSNPDGYIKFNITKFNFLSKESIDITPEFLKNIEITEKFIQENPESDEIYECIMYTSKFIYDNIILSRMNRDYISTKLALLIDRKLENTGINKDNLSLKDLSEKKEYIKEILDLNSLQPHIKYDWGGYLDDYAIANIYTDKEKSNMIDQLGLKKVIDKRSDNRILKLNNMINTKNSINDLNGIILLLYIEYGTSINISANNLKVDYGDGGGVVSSASNLYSKPGIYKISISDGTDISINIHNAEILDSSFGYIKPATGPNIKVSITMDNINTFDCSNYVIPNNYIISINNSNYINDFINLNNLIIDDNVTSPNLNIFSNINHIIFNSKVKKINNLFSSYNGDYKYYPKFNLKNTIESVLNLYTNYKNEYLNIRIPIKNISNMFSKNQYIKEINATVLDENLINGSHAFSECPYLEKINIATMNGHYSGLSRFENVTGMFKNCSLLKEIDNNDNGYDSGYYSSSLFNSNITNLDDTFYGCSSLEIIGLGDVGNITSFSNTFTKCSNLKYFKASNINADIDFSDTNIIFFTEDGYSGNNVNAVNFFKEQLPDNKKNVYINNIQYQCFPSDKLIELKNKNWNIYIKNSDGSTTLM